MTDTHLKTKARINQAISDALSKKLPRKYEIRLSYFFVKDGVKINCIFSKVFLTGDVVFYVNDDDFTISEKWLNHELSKISEELDSQHQSTIFPEQHYCRFIY